MFKVFKIILKNFLAFSIGGATGLIIAILFVIPNAMEKAFEGKEPGAVIAGAVALTPVFFIIYGAIGIIIGGFAVVIIYNSIKLVLRKKNKLK